MSFNSKFLTVPDLKYICDKSATVSRDKLVKNPDEFNSNVFIYSLKGNDIKNFELFDSTQLILCKTCTSVQGSYTFTTGETEEFKNIYFCYPQAKQLPVETRRKSRRELLSFYNSPRGAGVGLSGLPAASRVVAAGGAGVGLSEPPAAPVVAAGGAGVGFSEPSAAPVSASLELPEIKSRPDYIYYIAGLGNKQADADEFAPHFQKFITYWTKRNVIVKKFYANDYVGECLVVTSLYCCRGKALVSGDKTFADTIYGEISDAVKKNECDRVLLVGHSYGGLIASLIAKNIVLDASFDKSRIQIVTLGSIYTPVVNLNIVHIMHKCDVGLLCNKLIIPDRPESEFYDTTTKVYWKTSNICELPTEKTWFGSQSEWAIHNSYINIGYITKEDKFWAAYFKYNILESFILNKPIVPDSALHISSIPTAEYVSAAVSTAVSSLPVGFPRGGSRRSKKTRKQRKQKKRRSTRK